MSVYSYVCRDCKKKFELVQSITEHNPKKVTCLKCKSRKVDRVWATVNVQTSRKS